MSSCAGMAAALHRAGQEPALLGRMMRMTRVAHAFGDIVFALGLVKSPASMAAALHRAGQERPLLGRVTRIIRQVHAVCDFVIARGFVESQAARR